MTAGLLGLPLLVLLAFWAGRWLFAGRSASQQATASSTTVNETATRAPAAALAILSASIRSAHGASPEELAQVLASNKARADLDPELVDDDGFPAMTVRIREAADEALQEEISVWLAENGMADLGFTDEQWRALILATAVAGELASQATLQLQSADGATPALQLIPLLPAEWRIAQHRAAGMWLAHTVSQFGWPLKHIVLDAELAAGSHDASPSAPFARLAQQAAAPDPRVAAIVVAAASNIGEESLAQWAERGMLFTSSQPKGLIPGEGAAGLLVTDLKLAQSGADGTYLVLHPFEEGQRDTSADEGKRTDSKLLRELTERAVQRGGTDVTAVGMVIADTGHRSNRALELIGHVSATMPHLDGTDDVARAGLATGNCGAVPFMTALALAPHYALERKAQVLFVSNEAPFQRVVALIGAPDTPTN